MMQLVSPGRDPLSDGWYFRFMKRHPDLAPRQAQVVSRARNEVEADDMDRLFNSLLKVIIELRLDGSRLFNMDETPFESQRKSRKVIAERGAPNVWSRKISASFHLSIVAAASATGRIVPPSFLLPGERVPADILEGVDVPTASVTTTKKGFMDSNAFEKWLRFFSRSIADVPRAVVLMFDGYSSHYSEEIIAAATELQIIVLCLPANATHLIQPLDVAVFGPFKTILKERIQKHLIDTSESNMSKKTAVRLACSAWAEGVSESNITSGFEASGIWPLSAVKMKQRLNKFKTNCSKTPNPGWITMKEVIQTEVLTVPRLPRKTTRKRKTVDVAGRILTNELLQSESTLGQSTAFECVV